MSENNQPTLEACPFCGAGAFISWDGDVNSPDDWSANCDNTLVCGATVGGMPSEEAARKAWNTRVGSVAPTVDQLWEALKADHCKSNKAELIVFLTKEKLERTLARFPATAPPAPRGEEAARDDDVNYFDPISLMEKAMRTSMLIECDCPRESGACDGECLGAKIWKLIHRARKLVTNAAATTD